MAHIHFDLTAVERSLRQLNEETFAKRLSGPCSELERQGYEAQRQFAEASVLAQVEMLRLVNDGHDANFVGQTIGAFIGNLIINSLQLSSDPKQLMAAVDRTVGATLSLLSDAPKKSVCFEYKRIIGQKGGRA